MSTEREHQLEDIIRSTLWMARRYVDKRASYATSSYNIAARSALELKAVTEHDFPDGTPWAEDAMGREYSALDEEEWTQMMEANEKEEQWRAQQ